MIGSGGKFNLLVWLVSYFFLTSVLGGSCRPIPHGRAVCEVQGMGLESPYLNQEVIIKGLVIVDLEDYEPGGFVILDENCPLDGEASRGLYISLESGADLVDVGDEVQVRGIVRESAGESYLDASLQDLEILNIDNPLPGPVNLIDYLSPPLVFGYEKWEGQLVAIPRADLVKGLRDSEPIQILPRLSPDPPAQLVCFKRESFSLQINADLLGTSLGSIQSAAGLEDLVGLIRQDQDGYFLQLIQKPNLLMTTPDDQPGESDPVKPVSYLEKTSTLTSTTSATSTKTPRPSFSVTPTSRPTIIPSPTYYPINLLITEVMPNPSGEEPGGEWIEIYNPAGGRLSLDGIKIGDELSPSGKEGLLAFPDGFFIYQGQVLVIANQSRIFESWYGFLPDFELVDSDPRVPDLIPYDQWGRSVVKLSNSGDEVLLVDPWDRLVDLVVYGKSGVGDFSPPAAVPKEGHSLERYPPEEDHGQAENWRERSSPSPGRLDRSTPTVPATQTKYPALTATCSLTPATLTSTPIPVTPTFCPTPSFTFTQTPQVISTPVQSLTSTPESTSTWLPSQTPSPLPSTTLTEQPSLTSTSSLTPSITLPATFTETTISKSSVTPDQTPSPTGIPAISPTTEASSTSTPTIEPTGTTPSATQQFTPLPTEISTPSMTPTMATGQVIIINELLADPDPIQGDSNGDGVISSDDDEFLELVNISGQVLDLSGWQVFDGIRLRFTFPEGTSLASGCGLVVFGGGEPIGDFGGSLVFTAGSLGLNNGGDLIILVDPDEIQIAIVSYGSEGNQDQSLTRNPDLFGTLPLVLHSMVPEAGGALYSPGTKLDQSGFGDCP
jgi:hypothetical protein